MKFKLILCLLVSVLLGSCATQPLQFYKAGATPQDFERDRYECNRDVRMTHQVPPYPMFPSPVNVAGYAGAMSAYEEDSLEMYQRCMMARGWQPAGASDTKVMMRY